MSEKRQTSGSMPDHKPSSAAWMAMRSASSSSCRACSCSATLRSVCGCRGDGKGQTVPFASADLTPANTTHHAASFLAQLLLACQGRCEQRVRMSFSLL